MNIKKILLGTCAWLLISTLFGLGIAWGAYQTLSTPDSLKTALSDSGIYKNGVSAALEQSAQSSETQKDLPLDRPEVRQLVENAFTQDYIQTQSEKAIDSLYSWLHGDTPTLSFNIELGSVKDRLASGVGEYITKRLDTLPTCTSADQLPADGNVDPYSISCLPPGTDKAALAAQAKDKVVSGGLFKSSSVNANDLKDGDGKTVATQLQNGPAIYDALQLALYIAMASAVLLGAGIVFLSRTWVSGLHKLGIILMAMGTVSGIAAWLSAIGLRKLFESYNNSNQSNQAIQESIFKVITSLVDAMRSHWITYAVVVFALGAASFLAWYFLKPKGEETAQILAQGMPEMPHTPVPTKRPAPAGQAEHINKTSEKLPETKD